MIVALRELPPRAREAFIFHRFEELSHPAIARRMGISVVAVRKLIALGWEPRLRGQGFVARQSVPAGTPVGEGGVCLLELARFPVEPEPVAEGGP